MQIGNNLRALRRQKGATQEQLAQALGVSFQAVSKWETGTALPDITLVPALAGYFGVTTDDLLGFHPQERTGRIEAISNEARQYRETDAARSRQILEEGLKQYPAQDLLLRELLYVMNYSEKPEETIAVAEKLMEQTTQLDVKYDALRFLAHAYNAKGDTDSALAAIAQIPELDFTKLTELAFALTGKPKEEAAEKQKWISFENLLQMMWKLAECYEAEGNKSAAILETERAIKLLQAMGDEEKSKNVQNYVVYFGKQLERLKGR